MDELNKLTVVESKIITKIETQLGYMQLIEYVLLDYSYLHVLQWHYSTEITEKKPIPEMHAETFYKNKNDAIVRTYEIANNLLIRY